jgi:hypothetical protein
LIESAVWLFDYESEEDFSFFIRSYGAVGKIGRPFPELATMAELDFVNALLNVLNELIDGSARRVVSFLHSR